jgi:hypothetical protein
MLSKTPKAARKPRATSAPRTVVVLEEIPDGRFRRWPTHELKPEFEKVAEQVVVDMTELAKISTPKLDLQRAVKDSIVEWASIVFMEWARKTENTIRPSECERGDVSLYAFALDDTLHLNKAGRLAKALDQELKTLDRTAPGISGIAAMAADLVKKIEERQIECRSGGRPQGDSRYPGLNLLVHNMECFARGAGGEGFGLPKKQPQKGRILQLLDRLRCDLQKTPQLMLFASALPPPGRHPISVYQRAIKDAHAELSAEEHSSEN